MDIRKEWESCLRTPEVRSLFQTLKEVEGGSFQAFESLEQFIEFMDMPSPDAYEVKDDCLWRLIRHIQGAENRAPGLSLLTYLMANALQAILKGMVRVQRDLNAANQDLWWEFLQSVMTYPLERRPHKVAANLAMDTRSRVLHRSREEAARDTQLFSLGEEDAPIDPRFTDPLYVHARRLIEAGEMSGISQVDLEIVLASRVYGEDLRTLAVRAGISYEAARKRRQRAEQAIRRKWSGDE